MSRRELSRQLTMVSRLWGGGGGGDFEEYSNKADLLERGSHGYWFLIDPRKSTCIGYWDATTALALVFTALVTPYEVAFLPPSTTALDPLFLANRIIDAIFMLDMLLQFLLMSEARHESMTHGIQWNTKPWPIAKAYLQSWFALDLLSVLAGVFDYLTLLESSGTSSSTGDELQQFRILRVARTFRLIKLARLVRASRLMRRWANRLAINYARMALIGAIGSLVPLSHWVACIWAAVGYTQIFLGVDVRDTWLGTKGFCWPVEPGTSELTYKCFDAYRVYAASLYFAGTTITSIGYGDISPSPHNPTEHFFCMLLMMTSCVAWAQTIATFSGVASTLQPDVNAYRQTMDDLNRFMERESFPGSMRIRLRSYFNASRHLRLAETQRKLLQYMPPSLQGEVSWTIHHSWLRTIYFLRQASPRFMIELSMALHAVVFAPNDVAPRGYLYIVQRGVALYRGRVMTKGKVWGEDLILETVGLRHKATARAMNFLEAYYLSRPELLTLSSRHPETAQAIRVHAIWLALRREIVRQAHAIKASAGSMMTSAASSILDAIESGDLPAGVGLSLGRKTGDAPPEMVEVGAAGKLMESNDLAVSFEILGNRMSDERKKTLDRFERLEHSQAAILKSLEGLHTRIAQQSQSLDSDLNAKLAQAVLSVAAQTTTTTTRVALERAAHHHSPPYEAHVRAVSRHEDRHTQAVSRPEEDRVQDGIALATTSAPPARRTGERTGERSGERGGRRRHHHRRHQDPSPPPPQSGGNAAYEA